jgi:hypothetical protein
MRAVSCSTAALVRVGSASVLVLMFALGQPAAQSQQPATDLTYDAEGNLLRPTNFETWVFVGSNLGLGYAKDAKSMTIVEARRTEQQDYHNVYIDPAAYAAYLAKGTFPDAAMLVMDVYETATKEVRGPGDKPSVLNAGTFNGRRKAVEVAVKDSRRPNRRDVEGEDRSVGEWAYYGFDAKGTKARPHADSECFNCHRDHADDDNVWVQFYPTLRRVKRPD